jgi:hypothetical protein
MYLNLPYDDHLFSVQHFHHICSLVITCFVLFLLFVLHSTYNQGGQESSYSKQCHLQMTSEGEEASQL